MGVVFEGFGNIMNHKAQTITCPVNCVGVMGAGLAMTMRNRVVGLNEEYKKQCFNGVIGIGKVGVFDYEDIDKKVLLFPSKGHWKDNSNIKDIEEGLKDLVKVYKDLGITSLAMVPLGCGLGGLDYTKEVRPLLLKYLNELDIDVYILHRDDIK
jgi:O-acetyl-ADP-ribose deacetylase (regulator of RNase III)